MRHTKYIMVLAFAGVLGLTGAARAAVTAPYAENFDDGLAQDFTLTHDDTAPDAGWTVADSTEDADADAELRNITHAFSTESTATVQVNNLGGASGTDFTMSSTFFFNQITASSLPAGRNDTGFLALGDDGSGDGNYYLADFRNDGRTRITIQGSDSGEVDSAIGAFTYADNELYTLTLDGHYNGDGSLTLTLTLTDPDDGGTPSDTAISLTTDTTPYAGQYFGYRYRTAGADDNAELDVFADNFAIGAVPEPASGALALLGLGALAMLPRRKRSC